MPNYDFGCKQCNYEFEVKMSLKEKEENPNPKCPQCGGTDTKQVFKTMQFNKSSSKTPPACPNAVGGQCGSCPAANFH